MNLQFYVRYYRGDVFRIWCSELWTGGHAHGAYLVDLLGRPQLHYGSGMPDNVNAAQKLLEGARAVGWIVCVEIRPTVEQQFFGLGAAAYQPHGKYMVDWTYRPNKRESFRTFVKTGVCPDVKPLPPKYIEKLERKRYA